MSSAMQSRTVERVVQRGHASRNAVTRRRFIGIAGAAAGFALLPTDGRAAPLLHRWNGIALGAHASIQLVHPDAAEARRVIGLAVREIERLEDVFSLYRALSAVSRLNREGRLSAPPLELVELLARAAGVSEASGGAFDLTVQPLWQRYREHFAADPNATRPPPVDDVLPLVDWRGVRFDAGQIEFSRPGMAITLNGIAQGYVTDAVALLLRRNGIDQVALDLGETRTMGCRPDGRDWVVGIADPGDPARLVGRIDGRGRAIATSGAAGTVFDRAGRYGHLLDPRSGASAPGRRSITVAAVDACIADAWSTAFCLMDVAAIRAAARRLGSVAIYTVTDGGTLDRIA